MTQITKVHCDRCANETTADRLRVRDWAYCQIGLDVLDFCPVCWVEIMALAKVRSRDQ